MYVQRLSDVRQEERGGQRATGRYSMSSGLTGCGSGMMDFFSVSLDSAFLISAGKRETSQRFK